LYVNDSLTALRSGQHCCVKDVSSFTFWNRRLLALKTSG